MAYVPIDENDPISLLDDAINAALDDVASHSADAAAPTAPVAYMDWIDTDATDDPWFIRNAGNTAWTTFFYFGDGYRSVYCDTSGNAIEWGAPATGVTPYRLKLPTGAGAAGQTMRVSSTDTEQLEWFTAGAGVSAINDLSDVTISSPASGEVLRYDGTKWVNGTGGGGASALNDLSDVTISTAASGHHLIHDGSGFVNRALAAGDIPDLSSTYLVVATDLGDLRDVSAASPSSGDLLKWNGSAWTAANLALNELSAWEADADLTMSNATEIRFAELDANGSSYAAIKGADSMTSSYVITLPSTSYATADSWDPTGGTGSNLSSVLAFDNSTGQAFWIQISGDATGGVVVLSGTDEDIAAGGSAGTINRPLIYQPQIIGWSATAQSHDGSTGPLSIGGTDGDGSETLDLRYAAKLAVNGGAALPVEAGGTGQTSVTAGALLIGGTSTSTIPNKSGVSTAENNGATITPLIEVTGSSDAEFLNWDATLGRWIADVPVLSGLDDVGVASPSAGQLLVFDGTDWANGSTVSASTTFSGGLIVGGETATQGTIHLREIGAAGTNYFSLEASASMTDTYRMILPATKPSETSQVLSVSSLSGGTPETAGMQWQTLDYTDQISTDSGLVTFSGPETLVIAGGVNIDTSGADITNTVTIDFAPKGGTLAAGDIIYYDASSPAGFTRLPVGTTGQVLTVSSAGVPAWETLPA